MAAYRRVYDSHHLQADCKEPGSAPEPYTLGNRVWVTFLPCSYRIAPYLYSRLVFSIGLHSGVCLCCPYCVLRYTVVFAQVEYTRHLYVFAMRSPLVNFYYARTGQVHGLFTEA